ncbi:MAG: substrate-binding domain-containing protein [Anaerolineae bacterium]|nr:substrate-binding domain-containing protein [Anaerolineae bacterium]
MERAKHTFVAVAFTLVSCSAQITPAATPISQLTSLRVYATTAATPLLHDLTSAYRQQDPEAVFELASGSYAAIAERILREEGSYFFSHHLPDDIDNPQSPFWAAPVGQDALTILIHPSNPVVGISLDELRTIYAGRIQRWDAVGGNDEPIIVVARDESSGMRAEFEALVMGGRATSPAAQVVPSNQAMAETVARLPGAIGYGSLSDLSSQVSALPINGVTPSSDTVYDRTYPLRLTLYVVGRTEPREDLPDMRAFIGWVQSPAGQAVVAQRYTPLLRP